MKSLSAMAVLSLGVALAAQSASAQSTKHPKQPVDITADQAVMHNSDCTAVWTGSAEALQETSRLRADVMIVHMEIKKGKPAAPTPTSTGTAGNGDCGDMISIEAKGSVYFVSSDGRRVHGDNGFYDSATTTVTITGDVTAVKDNDVMRGTKMVYNTQTGEGHVEGSGKGPSSKARPRGVFYPKDSNADGDNSQGDKPKKAGK
jgi:lipopolysaccharide export system protein LptA